MMNHPSVCVYIYTYRENGKDHGKYYIIIGYIILYSIIL